MIRVEKNIVYANGQCLDIYIPEKENYETVVYFHGGGFENGEKDDKTYIEIAQDFAENGYGFISVNYRKYPNVKYPDFIEDGALAIKYAYEHIREYGGNGKIYVSGQSAGAYLALMLCLNADFLQKVGLNSKEIDGWIIDSAQTTSHFNVMKYELGVDSRLQRIDRYAPLYYVDKDTAFSKMLLLFYDNDMPCRLEQNKLFIQAVRQFNKDAKIEYQQLYGTHCYASNVKDEDGRYKFVKIALEWLKK